MPVARPPAPWCLAGPPDPVADVRIGVLTSEITAELVDEVIEVTGCREKRRRLLPARAVVYLVLGMCLLSGDDSGGPPGYRPVMRSLTAGLRYLAGAALPTRQALGKARARLGSKPLELLFDRVRGTRAAAGTPGAFAFGRRVVSWDATTLDAPRTPANLAAFGAQGGGQATPAVRLLALIECGTHAVIEAAFDGAARASEHDLARRVLHALGPGMLLLADRGLKGYELWTAACAGGADLAWRIPGNWVLPPEKVLPDGSWLAILRTPAESRQGYWNRLRGRPPAGRLVRVIGYAITVRAAGTTRTEHCRLITTLLDPAGAPAAALAALYHERWESEGAYGELKTRLKGAGFALRSKSPDLICQEMYALLTVYQALCSLETAAAATAGTDPGTISFTVTLRAVRDQAKSTDIITRPGLLGRALGWVITDMLADPLEKRRSRHNERAVNPRKRHYQARSPTQPRPPSTASYTITIAAPHATTTRPPRPPRTLHPQPPPQPP
jgi:Insertion element 4 transposase N-terminal/Transposase DDE domain